jgi:hypothetical protein
MARLADYPPRPADVAPNRARQRGWGDGWPHCQRRHIVAVQRGGVTLYVRREIAQLVATLLEATEKKHRYDVRAGQSWGFACRPIDGTRTPSNHSWGLAVDLNSRANPRAEDLRTDLPPAVVAMWWACGFFWGGWYRRRPDAMHFEYVRRPTDVAADLAAARRHLNGARTAPAFVPPPLRLTDPRTRGDRVRFVQGRLNANGAAPPLAVDGVWGPRTDAALRQFQRRRRLAVDGIYGPRTHAALIG